MFGPQRGPWQDESWQGWWGAADGKDVQIGGGAAVIQEYLREGLIDEMHLVR